ncbi:MAG: ORF6N domain-containing protein [Bacteroidota bacterium]
MYKEETTGQPPVTDAMVMEKIYWLRGYKVMLDKDLAVLYGYETKHLNQQVSRNRERFPASFMFQLTKDELAHLRSQNVTANFSEKTRVLPYAFTEHGVLMLANVLKSQTAVKVSVHIVEVFVKMREMILANKDILLKLQQLEQQQGEHSSQIRQLYQYIKAFVQTKSTDRKAIGFKTKATEA